MADELKVYMTSVSSASGIKGQQQRIFLVLDSKKITYTKVDISVSEEDKNTMRAICENEKALPPQFARGTTYLGDYEAFDFAVDDLKLNEFLKIEQ